MENNTEKTIETSEKTQETVENKQPIGAIFETMFYYSMEDLEKFISSINNEQAIYSIIEAVKIAHKRGAFNIIESEVVSKSIRILGTPQFKQ
jgi:hypothetical protein